MRSILCSLLVILSKSFFSLNLRKAALIFFHFHLAKANHEVTEIRLTYLNFDVFKKQLSTVSQIQLPVTPITPKSIVSTSFPASKNPTLYRSWLKLDKFFSHQSADNADIWGQFYSVRGGIRTRLEPRTPAPTIGFWHTLANTISLIPLV